MPSAEAGRYCDQCSKNVIDFSNYSEQAIIDYFIANNGKQICGRMRKSQIETIRIVIDQNLIENSIAYWKKFLIVLLIIFGYELFGAEFTFAQTTQMDSVKQEKLSIIENDSLHYLPVGDDSISKETKSNVDNVVVDNEMMQLYEEAKDTTLSHLIKMDKHPTLDFDSFFKYSPVGISMGYMAIEPTTPLNIIFPIAEFLPKSEPKGKVSTASTFINQSEHITIDDKREVPKKENEDSDKMSFILPEETRRKKLTMNFINQ
jgi:hypothetical protein